MSLDKLKQSEVKTSNETQISPETKTSPEGQKVSAETKEKLKTISSKEFLKISENERLKYITKSQIDSSKISSWEVKEVEFSFTFDGRFNKELYLRTTAGQVLPKEVKEVKVWEEIYTRTWLKWEFYNSQNRRLTIHEDTKLQVAKLRDTKEISDIETKNIAIFSDYKKENKDNQLSYDDLLKWAIDKWIDPKFAMFIFWDAIKDMPILSIDRQVKLEELLTTYHRIKNNFPNWNWNILEDSEERNNFILALLKETNENWKEKAKEYGIKEEQIEKYASRKKWIFVLDFDKIIGSNLSGLDFRPLSSKYPNEASIKNNNPAWLTWNPTFANTLDAYGINYYKGTSRPSAEWWSYFGFTNMEEWLNAFNLLWDIKLNKMWDKTFGQFAQNWAVDFTPYRNTFWEHWNTRLKDLDPKTIDTIKSAQMRIESPGMHKELSKLWVVV